MVANLNGRPAETASYRSLWISDVHLGTKHAQVGKLLDFLRDTECDHLYIVGDFIDGWQLRRKWFWTEDYNVLIQKLLRKNRKRTRHREPHDSGTNDSDVHGIHRDAV